MKLATLTRILLGLTFMSTGFIKSRRFGMKLMPEIWEEVNEEFHKMNKALKDFPGRDSVHVTADQAQEFFSYTDLICGFLLVTGNFIGVATFFLIIGMAGLEYTLFIMKYPVQYQGIVIGLLIGLFSISSTGERKEKED